MSSTALSSTTALTAEDVRAKFTGNRVDLAMLAEGMGCTQRTLYNYCEDGMPFIRVAGKRYVDPDEAKDWLIQQAQQRREPSPEPEPVRGPGRPAKSAPVAPAHVESRGRRSLPAR
ncbi:hypothetical protein [Rhodopila sp.]|uniref:hypothetical protein n=1 Tax=Rhodopila sp. TaxID=2480087 RepID=UPI003D0D83C9